MHDAREIYMNAVVGLPSSERLRLAALILSELAQEGESPASITQCAALELLDDLPGKRLFKNAAEADAYLDAERESWDG